MKKLFCLLLCLTLLCCAALPAVAEEQSSYVTARYLFGEIKQDELADLYWIPVWDTDRSLKLDWSLAGTYCWTCKGANNSLFGNTVTVCSLPAEASQYDMEFASPYQIMMFDHGFDTMTVSAQNLAACQYRETVSLFRVPSMDLPLDYNMRFKSACVGTCYGAPAAFLQYEPSVSTPYDPYNCVAELVIAFSPQCMISVRFRQWTYRTYDNVLEAVDLAGQLGLRFVTLGDADLNGQVNAVDGLLTLKHAVQKAEIADELAFALADWNDDGALDAGDALHTLQKAVGKAR